MRHVFYGANEQTERAREWNRDPRARAYVRMNGILALRYRRAAKAGRLASTVAVVHPA